MEVNPSRAKRATSTWCPVVTPIRVAKSALARAHSSGLTSPPARLCCLGSTSGGQGGRG